MASTEVIVSIFHQVAPHQGGPPTWEQNLGEHKLTLFQIFGEPSRIFSISGPNVAAVLLPYFPHQEYGIDMSKHSSYTAGDAARAAINRSSDRLLTCARSTNETVDSDVLRRLRISTRTLRSDIRTFAPLLNPVWSESLRADLAWLAGELRVARDLDVIETRIVAGCRALTDNDAPAAQRLLARLEVDKATARIAVVKALRTERFSLITERLIDVSPEAIQRNDENGLQLWQTPASSILPGLVAGRWKKLYEAAENLTVVSTEIELHSLRLLVKRCRYAAEAARPAVGKDARQFATALQKFQRHLGEVQDSTATEAWLRAGATNRGVALVAGQLITGERVGRAKGMAKISTRWDKVAQPSLRTWLK
jgi:CHAD domain-containing protein